MGASPAVPSAPVPSGSGTSESPADFDAVVLAGGRASRLGGGDKPGLRVGTRTLLASVVSAASAAGARRIVVVGPDRPELPGGLAFVREEPPGSGPVPALRRGLAEVSAPTVLVLAADLPFLRARHLRALLAARRGLTSGAIMVDDTGRPQWLAGAWRTAGLRAAIQAYEQNSLHGLLLPLEPATLDPAQVGYDLGATEPPPWLDCDTAEDLARARAWPADAPPETDEPPETAATGGAPVSTLERWTEAASAELGLDPALADTKTVLDLARDVAHGVARPAAPLTAYLLGVAVGRGQPVADAAARLRELAEAWADSPGTEAKSD
jgi:molybdopterin-guanine dinucleotide biosynthesis protein A